MKSSISKLLLAATVLLGTAAPLAAQNLVNGSDFPITPPTSGFFAPMSGNHTGFNSSQTKSAVASLGGTGNPLTVLGGASLSTTAANQVLAIMTGGAAAGAASTEISVALMAGGASSAAVSEFLTAMAKVYNSTGPTKGLVEVRGLRDAVSKFNALINSITDGAVLNNPPSALLGFHAVLTTFVTAAAKAFSDRF